MNPDRLERAAIAQRSSLDEHRATEVETQMKIGTIDTATHNRYNAVIGRLADQ